MYQENIYLIPSWRFYLPSWSGPYKTVSKKHLPREIYEHQQIEMITLTLNSPSVLIAVLSALCNG